MNANILATADALSDQELLTRIPVLAGREREAATELIAHLAVLDTRPVLYAAKGYGSLFRYCTDALGLSEDAACNRVLVARACRRFPVILDLAEFTMIEETHDKYRRVQALLRREIPDGDLGLIFDQAITVLLDHLERTKLGKADRPRARPLIRPGTDKEASTGTRPSRHVPREVKRVVWKRDGSQCAFVSAEGRRCTERTFLEFHHVQPYARHGPATVANISLRCWRHNQYEAELIFGPHGTSIVRERALSSYDRSPHAS
jgi:hypothetical protein